MKSRKYQMNLKTADQTLQNVFAACDRKPNSIPFERIIMQKKIRTRSTTICMWVCILLLIATLLSPFLFLDSSFRLIGRQDTSHHITVEEHYMKDDCFTIRLSGDNIDYKNISTLDEDGNAGVPDVIDAAAHTICFNQPVGTINIYIPDTDGHTLTAVLTVDKED